MMRTDYTIPFTKLEDLVVDSIAHENPYMSNAEANALLVDIKQHGQLVPVSIFNDKLIDGRNRLKAVSKLERDLRATKFTECSYSEAVDYSRSENDHRRHLDTSQIAMKTAKDILSTRVDKGGVTKKRSEWKKLKDHTDVLNGKVSLRSLQRAISIATSYEFYAEQIFKGERSLAQVDRIIKEQKQREVELEHQNHLFTLEQGYKSYHDEGMKNPELIYGDGLTLYLESEYSPSTVARFHEYVLDEVNYSREKLAKNLIELEEKIHELEVNDSKPPYI